MHGLTQTQYIAKLRETTDRVVNSMHHHKLYAMVKKRVVPQLSWGKFTNNRLQVSYEAGIRRAKLVSRVQDKPLRSLTTQDIAIKNDHRRR